MSEQTLLTASEARDRALHSEAHQNLLSLADKIVLALCSKIAEKADLGATQLYLDGSELRAFGIEKLGIDDALSDNVINKLKDLGYSWAGVAKEYLIIMW